MAANRYFKTYGVSKKTLAKVAVKNHHNGTKIPKAHLQMEVNEERCWRAPMIYSPLGLFDCCPTTDGAAAAIVCRADVARERSRADPIWPRGSASRSTSGEPY